MNQNEMIAGYVGTDPVQALYLGSELIWPTSPEPTPPYEEQYFTVEAVSAGTFNIRKPTGLYYSLNGGAWTAATASMNLRSGDKVRFKGDEEDIVPSQMFTGNTMDFKVYGNIMSLGYPDDFSVNSVIPESSYFSSMFRGSTGLVDASNLILPTGVTNFCYQEMFSSCSNLVKAPELPAETLSNFCYFAMFYGCTSLIYIKCLATDISATNCTLNWVSGITTDGVFVQASGATWTQGVNIPETWMPIDAPEHDEGVWAQYWHDGAEYWDEESGTTEDMGATYTFPELITYGYVGNISLFSDGHYVFLDEVDICGYDCSDSECSVICGGEGGDDGKGNYIECNIMTGDTRYISPSYQVMDITYTPASNMLSIQTHAEDCGGEDFGCCWDTRGGAYYRLCGCDFERLVDQMVAYWSDGDGGYNYLYIRYADDKDYYGEVLDANDDVVGNYIIFNQGDEEEFPIGNNNSIFVGYNTDEYCLEISTANGVYLEEVDGFHLETPPACDFCQDWEEMGYESREDCLCQEYYDGECWNCEDWESRGYESFEDCMCQEHGRGCN